MADITLGTARASTMKKSRGPFREFVHRLFSEKPLGAIGAVVCVVFLITGIFSELIAPYGYNEMNPIDRLQAPSLAHWMGTDQIGRDVFSRVVHGARTSVIIGFSAATISILISILIGITTGFFGRKFDMIVQRVVDAWMSFPDLVIVIVAVSVFGPGMWQVILILSLLYGIAGSRIVRGAVIGVKENASNPILFHRMMRSIDPADMVVVCGSGHEMFPYAALCGCRSLVTEVGNFAAGPAIEMYEAGRDARFDRLMACVDRLDPYVRFREKIALRATTRASVLAPSLSPASLSFFVAVCKEAMRITGTPYGRVREPLENLTEDDTAELEATLKGITS